MELNNTTFRITYYSNKDKKHITTTWQSGLTNVDFGLANIGAKFNDIL